MTCGIYKITERETGRCYIGQSINIEERWYRHQGGRGKFPASAFDYEILLVCNVDCLNFFEKAFIFGYDSHRNGFNMTIGGTSIKATHISEETRAKIGAKSKGRKHAEEARQKISAAKKGKPSPHKGKSLSEEARQNMSKAAKGRKSGPRGPSPIKGKKLGPLPKLQCAHCGILVSRGLLNRWHGDNCKHKKEINNGT